MKAKNIIVSLIAALGFLMTGCVEEVDHFLDEVKVSSSYVTFPAEGGSVSVNLTATDAWTVTSLPDWVTVSPSSGGAGEISLSFTAAAADDSREATAKIECGGKTQNINLLQVTQKSEPVTMSVKEALAVIAPLADQEVAGGTYRVKGIVCKIVEISKQYGNATYYLSDDGSFTEGNCLQVYRGLWLNGAAITSGDEFSVGDELTIEGSLMNYKGTPETKEKTAIVVSYKKSLISVDAFSFNELPYIDTTFNMVVTAKESPLLVSCDADWLQITDVNKDGSYKLHADENSKTAKRTANITIKGPTALKTIGITQSGAPSTGASVTEIIAAADNDQVQTLPSTVVVALTTRGAVLSDGTNAIYAYGDKAAALKVGDGIKMSAKKTTYNGVPELTDITDVFVDSEGNAVRYPDATDITANAANYTASVAEYIKLSGTLSVSDDAKYYNMTLDGIDPATKMGSIVYPIEALNAKSFNGKKIIVTGYFNGLSSKGRYINIIATKIGEFVDNPKGTLKNPYEATEVANMLKDGTTFDGNVYVKGIINKIDDVNLQYGNAQYWLSTDGSSADLEVWRGFFYDGDKFTAQDQIKVGDEVVVYGKPVWYADKSIAEMDQKNYLVIINGKAAPKGTGTAEDPYNVTKLATMLLAGESIGGEVYAKGIISQIDNVNLQYGNAQYWISDDGTKAFQMEIYRGLWFGGATFTSEDQIAIGDEVVVFGKVKVYEGTPEFDQKNRLVFLNGRTE